uniref:GB1/RHD3-type G domain-containing protein n=1 Tax=Pyrodinium bahamense TaxID=73915 RepID=A0A7S0FNM2_9DINO
MGAFRTGKSFLLDLFLRYLRHGQSNEGPDNKSPPPPRGSGSEFPLPAWVTASGNTIDGASDESCSGFRFKGGMEACTEGIWVWSEPFVRDIKGRPVALVLMDTQGAWDSCMTKEQSASIFGLTAVLSSKQIYNINMQIQEDKVENLAYFMRFAQAAIRKASSEMAKSGQECNQAEVERPFQSLDFLVRDWRHFREDWSIERCKEQMEEHFSKHLDPKKVVENSTAEALHSMFDRIGCFCLPHPGLTIERETWTGNVHDISTDFIRFVDAYMQDVFSEALDTKSILGSELSTITFPLVLRDFVNAFHDAAPVAMSFTQAMTNATVLLAKEQAMQSYTKKMDEAASSAPRGMEPKQFEDLNLQVSKEIQAEFQRVTIFGPDSTREDAWKSIEESLQTLYKRYVEDNSRRLEKALVAFANIALLGLSLFVLDRVSDWTCDWWSQTCVEVSKLMLMGYLAIAGWIGVHVYLLINDRGRLSAAVAAGELWKEMLRLLGEYSELAKGLHFSELQDIIRKGNMDKKND